MKTLHTNWTYWEVSPDKEKNLFFENLDTQYWHNYRISGLPRLTYVIVGCYLVGVYLTKLLMKGRKPVTSLRPLLVLFFLLSALFALVGSYRSLPRILDSILQNHGFHHVVCHR